MNRGSALETARAEPVVALEGVSRQFGRVKALDDVTLRVPRGVVFGLVGVNGAGKTTLLKHVLGLLKPQSGRVRVLGRDPVADPVGVLSRVGYLAEENDLPGWMRVGELTRYMQGFYSTWDEKYADHLLRSFELDPAAKVKHLSKGQRARAGLLVALAYRPEILLLDDPSSGLDPIVRRDILGAIIRTISEEGRTVLFSSHLLHEVERVADHIALLDKGRVVVADEMDRFKRSFCEVTLQFEHPLAAPPCFVDSLRWRGSGREWTAIVPGELDDFARRAAAAGARIVARRAPTLDEIFVAQVGPRIVRAEPETVAAEE